MELGKDDAVALAASGLALAYVVRDLDAGPAFIDRALGLNPNLTMAWFFWGLDQNLAWPPARSNRTLHARYAAKSS